jgi:hypothetical protein
MKILNPKQALLPLAFLASLTLANSSEFPFEITLKDTPPTIVVPTSFSVSFDYYFVNQATGALEKYDWSESDMVDGRRNLYTSYMTTTDGLTVYVNDYNKQTQTEILPWTNQCTTTKVSGLPSTANLNNYLQ